MTARIAAFDWGETSLGARESWPGSLTTALQLVLEAPQVATLAVGPDRVFLYNDAAAALYGDRHPGVLGLPLAKAFPHEFDEVSPFYDRVFEGEGVHVPAQQLDPSNSGTPEIFDAYLTPVRDAAGNVIAAHMIGFATGAKLRSEMLLRESEERFRALVESVPVGVAVVDLEGRVVHANSEYRRFLPTGVIPSCDPDRGWRWQAWDEAGQLVDPQNYPGARARRGEYVIPGQEMVYTDDSGRNIWTRVATVPIYDPKGHISGSASVISDIDALKQSEAVLRRSEERQKFLLDIGDAMRSATDANALIATSARMLGEKLGASRVVFAEIDDAAGVAIIRPGWYADGAEPHPAELKLSDFSGPLLDDLRAGRAVRYDEVGAPPYARSDLAALAEIGVQAGLSIPLLIGRKLAFNLNVHQHEPRIWTDEEVSLVEDVAERSWAALQRARAEAALRKSEEQQVFLLELSDAIRALDLDTDIMTLAAARLGEYFGVERVGYGEIDTDQSYLDVRIEWRRAEVRSAVGRQFLSEYGPLRLAHNRTGEDWVVANVETDGRAAVQEARDRYLSWAVRAAVSIPLIKRGAWRASLYVNAEHPRRWTDQEVHLIREVAERTWTSVERARSEAALREREAELARTQRIGQVASFDVFLNGKIVGHRSPEYRLLHGLPPERVTESHADWLARIHPDDRNHANTAFQAAISDGGEYESDYRIVRPSDGAERWIAARGVVERDAAGRIFRLQGAHIDITDRKRAEEELREGDDRRSFLLKLSDALRPLIDASAIQDYTAELVGERLGTSRTIYCLVNGEAGGQELSVTAQHVKSGDPVPQYLPANAFGDSLASAMSRGERISISDVSTDPRIPAANRQAYATLNIAAFVSIPLIKHGRPMALLSVHSHVTRDWRPGEIALLCEVAERAWEAIERARSEAAVRESEGRLSLAIHVGGFATWDWDIKTDEVRWSDEHYLMEGYKIGEVQPSCEAWLARVHPDDRAGAEAALEKARTSGEEFVHEFRSLHPNGDIRWLFARGRFYFGPSGAAARMIGVMEDFTQERLDQEALRKSEERLRQFGEASQDILWIRDAETLQWTYLTPAFETIYGLSREEALAGQNYRNWLQLIVPEDRKSASDNIRRVREGEKVTFEYRVRRPSDGAIRLLRNTDFPITDDSGKVTMIGGVGHDATEAREAQLRLQTLVEGIPQLVWRAVDDGEWTWASPQWMAYTGQSEGEYVGWGWLRAVHPDDREDARNAWSDALEQGGFEVEYRLSQAASGEYRWFQTRAAPVRDKAGTIIEWLGASTEINELRELQGRQGVMVTELQHRTRNLITVVRALSEQTARNAESIDDFRTRFNRRLSALSRVQGMLSQLSAGQRVTFDELLRSELGALGALDAKAGKVTLHGPAGVQLRSATVQTFALALHELATNAVKYGAFAVPDGHLTVRWDVSEDAAGETRWLHADWRESGVSPAEENVEPQGRGYGRELIERALPYQLKARTSYEVTASGVHCTIDVPISPSAWSSAKG